MNAAAMPDLKPYLEQVDPEIKRRILLTLSCRDSDDLTRVDGAGEIVVHDGVPVQRMFNGVVVEEGGYYGDLITPIILGLNGVHEPQEEVVVDRLVDRLNQEQLDGTLLRTPIAVELGSYWAYYSIWFCSALHDAHAVAMEPDPTYLEVGRRNAVLNDVAEQITFLNGAIGATPGIVEPFTAESDRREYSVMSYDLETLMRTAGVTVVDVLFCDIQGFETLVLERAESLLSSGAIRFLVVSTHHHSISGDPLTHQRALVYLSGLGAHIIAEHTVSESFSGDGLIVASFTDRDRDLHVPISHARAKDSLFGELEPDIEHYRVLYRREAERVSGLEAELDAIRRTRLWRWSSGPRAAYSALRRRATLRITDLSRP
jgi:FkbM family methyltransferase